MFMRTIINKGDTLKRLFPQSLTLKKIVSVAVVMVETLLAVMVETKPLFLPMSYLAA